MERSFPPGNRARKALALIFDKRDTHTRSGPGEGWSSGPSGIESIGGNVMVSSGESFRIPMSRVGTLGFVVNDKTNR